jgi:hypothetical protein
MLVARRSRVAGFRYCDNERCAGYGRLDLPWLVPGFAEAEEEAADCLL